MNPHLLRTLKDLETEICDSVKMVKHSYEENNKVCLPDYDSIISALESVSERKLENMLEATTWLGDHLHEFKKFNAFILFKGSLFKKQTRLLIKQNELVLNGDFYHHQDIEHLKVDVQKGGKSREDGRENIKKITLTIYYDDGRPPIVLSNRMRTKLIHCQGQSLTFADTIWATYLFLARKTFKRRLTRYQAQLDICNYFEYQDGDTGELIVFNRSGVVNSEDFEFMLYERDFSCIPGKIVFEERSDESNRKGLKRFTLKKNAVSTKIDHDVFFYMLQNCYNMTVFAE